MARKKGRRFFIDKGCSTCFKRALERDSAIREQLEGRGLIGVTVCMKCKDIYSTGTQHKCKKTKCTKCGKLRY
jgi:hypothetical protein